ncbi:amidinotransferase [Vibrio sp. Y2-5]|uniref:dimethylarginine dimethylaminohydrolase family protein n=1 Tax=Vibrio sp. Y2-5 TaxID=2743977 RepID=UPI00166180A3|nr:arginine deiminase family protein [Vibrio sp. Y2-5]MBD0788348.1 amidinotransferase [Vibrio sp. Y2-5]
MSNHNKIFVESEFAPLKRVILARSEFGFPSQALSAEELDFLPEDARNLFKNVKGGDHSELFPERHEKWLAERENFKSLLIRYGVEVLEPRALTATEKKSTGDKGYSNFFVRDPIFTVGDFVIEGSMRFMHRRQEVLPVRPIVNQHVMAADCQYLAVPQPELFDKDDTTFGNGPYLEGGDVIVLGKHVLVGSSGLASNKNGMRWLKKLLSPYGYTVEYVPLKPDILHLDCALSLARPGLMIVCESAFLNGLPDILKGWDRISLAQSECAYLAANGLPINEDVYVIDPVFETIGNRLSTYGVHVETVDFSITRCFGGSFRCSTQPLLRSNSYE